MSKIYINRYLVASFNVRYNPVFDYISFFLYSISEDHHYVFCGSYSVPRDCIPMPRPRQTITNYMKNIKNIAGMSILLSANLHFYENNICLMEKASCLSKADEQNKAGVCHACNQIVKKCNGHEDP